MESLKKIREKKGITQEKASQLIGTTLRNYQKIENCYPEVKPNIELGLNIASLYKKNPYTLWQVKKIDYKP